MGIGIQNLKQVYFVITENTLNNLLWHHDERDRHIMVFLKDRNIKFLQKDSFFLFYYTMIISMLIFVNVKDECNQTARIV